MQTILQIPTPCNEKWSEMTPVRHDCKYCAVCEKQIVDFTLKTDAEILEHLRRNSGKVCGKFRRDQLARPLMAPRAVKRSGLTAIAASIAALLSAQRPLEGNRPIDPPIHNAMNPSKAAATDSMRTISGKISDPNGEALIGATIKLLQGADFYKGVTTDYNGCFHIRIPINELQQKHDALWNLEVHYIGFSMKSQSLPKAIYLGDIDIPIRMEGDSVFSGLNILTAPSVVNVHQVMGQVVTTEQLKNLPLRSIETMVPNRAGTDPVDGLPPTEKTSLKSRTRHFFHRLFKG